METWGLNGEPHLSNLPAGTDTFFLRVQQVLNPAYPAADAEFATSKAMRDYPSPWKSWMLVLALPPERMFESYDYVCDWKCYWRWPMKITWVEIKTTMKCTSVMCNTGTQNWNGANSQHSTKYRRGIRPALTVVNCRWVRWVETLNWFWMTYLSSDKLHSKGI